MAFESYGMMGGYGGMGFGYGWLFQLIIFILFFLVVWWLLRNNGALSQKSQKESPMDILKRRLASGEISKKEFNDLKKEIE